MKLLKNMFESLFRRDFCWHCHVGITAYPINTAIKKGIPLLFYGEPLLNIVLFIVMKILKNWMLKNLTDL